MMEERSFGVRDRPGQEIIMDECVVSKPSLPRRAGGSRVHDSGRSDDVCQAGKPAAGGRATDGRGH